MSKIISHLACLLAGISLMSCKSEPQIALKHLKDIPMEQLQGITAVQGAVGAVSQKGTIMLVDANSLMSYSTIYQEAGRSIHFKAIAANDAAFFLLSDDALYTTASQGFEKVAINELQGEKMQAISFIGKHDALILTQKKELKNHLGLIYSNNGGKSWEKVINLEQKALSEHTFTIKGTASRKPFHLMVQNWHDKWHIVQAKSLEELYQWENNWHQMPDDFHYTGEGWAGTLPVDGNISIYLPLGFISTDNYQYLPHYREITAIKKYAISGNNYTFLLCKEGIFYHREKEDTWQHISNTTGENFFLMNNQFLFLQQENNIAIFELRIL